MKENEEVCGVSSIKMKKIPLASGGFLTVEDCGNPYDAVEKDKTLYANPFDDRLVDEFNYLDYRKEVPGVRNKKVESDVEPEVIELTAPQPHEVPKMWEKVLDEKGALSDGEFDMKKALDIASAIMVQGCMRQVDERVEISRILDRIKSSFNNSKMSIEWDRGTLSIRTGITNDEIFNTFKTLENTLGNADIARNATVDLILSNLRRDYFAN